MHGGLAVADRLAEITAQRALEKADVLHGHVIVEAHGLAEMRHVLGRRVGRQEQRRGVAREMENQENDDGYAEEDQHRLPQASQQVRPHAVAFSRRATASMWGVWGNMSTGCTHSSR